MKMATMSTPASQGCVSLPPCPGDIVRQNLSFLKPACPLDFHISARRSRGRKDHRFVLATRADTPSEEQATLNWGPALRDTTHPPTPHYTTPKREIAAPTPISSRRSPLSEESVAEYSESSKASSELLLEPELVFQQLDYVLLRSQGKIDKIVENKMKGVDKISLRMDATQRSMDVVSGKVDQIIKTATPKIRKIRTQSVAREEMRQKLKKVTNVFTDPVKEKAPEPEEKNDVKTWSVGDVFTKWFGSLVLALALGASGAPLLAPPEASAFELPFEVPREWLKEQKRKNSAFILAPITNSKNRMEQVRVLIDGEMPMEQKYSQAKDLVKAASLDCMPYLPGSYAELQAKTGIEQCTFKLITKNAASLLTKDDPQRLQANAELKNLINSFVELDILLDQELSRSGEAIRSIPSAVRQTQSALDTYEIGIKSVLGVTPSS